MASQGLAITISRSDLANFLPVTPAKITDFETLASYSWWDKPTPTISVPGSPPLWSPPSTARRLEPDSGAVYIDQNAARCPASPLEPLFRAVLIEKPDFSLSDVDLVTDRNNVRKLLRFVQASSSCKQFQIRVEVVTGDYGDDDKTTALFTRVEPKTMDFVQEFRGYGRNFEKAYTKPPSAFGRATGYYRIAGFNFGGMRCVVRSETDAYVGGSNMKVQGVDDSLSDAPGGLSLSGPEKMASGLTVLRSGDKVKVAASSTLKIKTRAASRTLDMDDVSPQLWISQTPKLAVGYHHGGLFNNVQVRDMTDEILRWEAANQGDLRKLAGLLAEIIRVVKQAADRQAVVEYAGGSTLRIIASDGKPALPEDLYTKLSAKSETTPESGTAFATSSLIPVDTPFASDMEYAIEKGPRQFFRRLPGTLSSYRLLCAQLRSLPLDIAINKVLGGRGLTYKSILADFRRGKSDWDPEERSEMGGLKTLSRDAAFRLVYVLLARDPETEDRPMAYNAAFFVVSHFGIFGPRTQQMVRAAFADRFSITYKQRCMMDGYAKASEPNLKEEDDATTPAEYDWYGSDSDDGYYTSS
ncbi:hypothetical protein B0T22DRAFT_521087 [Podospora appendiculata]|uniref:Geranylgeranyl pyrophosphate synthetase n=1 Tax=Podospora appendiculata TaxID=314037 RepID=A0AAE0X0A2_9PEZI|nr:hypothetical protein B0T22DRAFT_521087 [Podospora appendiculata]